MAEIRLGRAEVEKGRLPKACMVCGARATVKRKKTFKWSPAWTRWVGGAILAAFLSKKMTINAPFCHEHRFHWLIRSLVGFFGFIGVFVVSAALLIFVAIKSAERGQSDKPMLIAAGFGGVLFLFWLITVIVLHQSTIRAKEITDKSMTMIGVSNSFISALRDLREERRSGTAGVKRSVKRLIQVDAGDEDDDD